MADNVTLPGTGAVIATDEAVDGTLGTVQFQYVKLVDGTLGGTTKVAAGSNGLKVDGSGATQPVSAASLPLPSGASTAAKQPALGTAGSASADVISIQGVASMTAVKVDNSAVTQPISASSLPLPTGAATSAKQPALGTAGSASSDVISVQGIASMTALKVDASATTQPISAASLPLPSGASTAAKQPALGTAGSASSDVITVQGVTSMTALKVDGSGVTQPVSGTVSAAQSGTWTVQPGNTANTTAWKVDGSAVTQPVSGTITANAGTGNFGTNVAQISGSTVSTAATGVQKVGVVGNAGATVDATVGAGTAPTNAVITGALFNSTNPAPTTGQSLALQTDQSGALRTFAGMPTATLSAWTSATSINATQTIFSNSGADAVLVQLVQTTTITVGAATFEVTFDGTNWVTIPANCVVDPTSTTYAAISLPYTLQASTNKPFLLISNGWQGLRVKLSTAITGSGSVTPNYALLGFSPVDVITAYQATAANLNCTASQGGTWTVQPGNTANTTAWKVDGSAVTQPVSAASLPLPSGASTAAKQPALGTAGSASADVISVQGIASMTALKVDGSGVTQPVSGTVTATANQSGTWTVQPGNTPNTSAWLTQSVTGTGGGWSVSSQTALTNTKTQVKSGAGNFGGYMFYNPNASVEYIQVWDVASGSITVGTTAPTYVIPIPATTGANVEFSVGIAHATAINIAATTTPTGSTAPGTALVGFVIYK